MNDQVQRQDPADEELQARLDRYARARLGSDPAAMARIRANLMIQARARSAERHAASPRHGFISLFRRPVLGLAGAALVLLLVVGGAAAASAPGGPLYATRLWIETLTLPSDPVARTDAELVRLEDRLTEAQAAAAAGDASALAAALQAYDVTLDAARAAAGADPTREQHVSAELAKHQAVLEALVVRLAGRGNASAAIQRVLDENQQVIDQIDGNSGQPSATPGQPTPGQGNGQGNGQGTGQGNGQGNGQGAGGTPPAQGPNATPPAQGGNGHGPGGTPPGQGPKATPPGQDGPKPTPKGKPPGGSGPGAASTPQPTPAP